jgi:hypothetical protein
MQAGNITEAKRQCWGFFIWPAIEEAAGLLFTTIFHSDEDGFTS